MTPVLALTGTADKHTQKVIISSLALRSDALHIFLSPNRPNLRINVIKTTKKEALSKLDWLIELCCNKGADTPKTILFCNTMRDVANLVNHLMLKLGTSAYIPPTSRKSEDCLIGIYHSLSWKKYKETIVTQLKSNGKKRLVVATTALSMGVNFPNIRYIINWGPARNLLDHHQEAGRAGRDGKQSDVVIIYHGQQLTHCEASVKSFVKSSGCLRVASYRPFDPDIKPLEPSHDCCSNCKASCKCSGEVCTDEPLPFEESIVEISQVQTVTYTRSVSETDKSVLYSALLDLKASQSADSLPFDKTVSHGFSVQLIQDIVQRCAEIFSIEDIISSFPVFAVGHAVGIIEVFQEIFGDIPNYDDILPLYTTNPSSTEQLPDYLGYFDIYDSDTDSDLDLEVCLCCQRYHYQK